MAALKHLSGFHKRERGPVLGLVPAAGRRVCAVCPPWGSQLHVSGHTWADSKSTWVLSAQVSKSLYKSGLFRGKGALRRSQAGCLSMQASETDRVGAPWAG